MNGAPTKDDDDSALKEEAAELGEDVSVVTPLVLVEDGPVPVELGSAFTPPPPYGQRNSLEAGCNKHVKPSAVPSVKAFVPGCASAISVEGVGTEMVTLSSDAGSLSNATGGCGVSAPEVQFGP